LNHNNPNPLITKLHNVVDRYSNEDEEIFGCKYQIAAGAAIYNREMDKDYKTVFDRADQAMYEDKKKWKMNQK
ncbi:MAG: hypothetical protein K6F00_07045, partial [Lachnospiraceae bacterium]|nr:hypothetical protein [Lachnospiraceae bacterium]